MIEPPLVRMDPYGVAHDMAWVLGSRGLTICGWLAYDDTFKFTWASFVTCPFCICREPGIGGPRE